MGLFKRARKILKKVASPVTGITEKVLKPIVRPLRPIGARAAVLTGFGLVAQPEFFGIKSARSQKAFTNTQRAGRIVAGAAAAVYAAPAVISTASAVLPTIGTGLLSAAKPVMGLIQGAMVPPGAVGGDLGNPIYSWDLAEDARIKARITDAEKTARLGLLNEAKQTAPDGPENGWGWLLLPVAGVGVAIWLFLRGRRG
jgi:hypothetical protein